MNDRYHRLLAGILVIVVLSIFPGCQVENDTERKVRIEASSIHSEKDIPKTVQPSLWRHTAEFKQSVYQVTDGVHQAVGWGIANSIMVEGKQCNFIVDACGSLENGKAVLNEFRKVSNKPIGALIYTHNHADHIFGSHAFGTKDTIDVYSHETTNYYINRVINIVRPGLEKRSNKMFGTYLPAGAKGFVNGGLGPYLEILHGGGTPTLLRPNKTFRDELETTICDVQVKLVHAPGETDDQIFVWLPEKKVLMPGDNIYRTFPNLYTIRGTPYRDVIGWVQSIDKMRSLKPSFLAPSHTRPVIGEVKVASVLTAYRDAMQFVHDQTIRLMNKGLPADEIVEKVQLPDHLRKHPFLLEHYGTVEWSVRSIFSGYFGWFDGDAANLSKPSPLTRAAGMVEIAGGRDNLLSYAQNSLKQGSYKWAAEVANYLIRIDPDDKEARQAKADALRQLGYRSVSPNGRNWYLTEALELEGKIDMQPRPTDSAVLELVKTFPIGSFIEAMTVNLDPEKSLETNQIITFNFPDVKESHSLHVRKGVAEYIPHALDNPDIELTLTSGTWVEIVAGKQGFPGAVVGGKLKVKGGLTQVPKLIGFLSKFQ